MAKRRKTIGRNPLDELGPLKGRGRKVTAPAADPEMKDDIRAMLARRRQEPSLLEQLGSALQKLNPFG